MSTTDLAHPESGTIRIFFDSIAQRYDFLNQVLSLRLDDFWRLKSKEILLESSQKNILDLGTGTGKFLELFLKEKKWTHAAGLDFSRNMLEKAREQNPNVKWVNADFHHLPFQTSFFDLVISSFTLRSVQDLPFFFKEVYRVLSKGGKAGFLCLTRPVNPVWRALLWPYLKFYLPAVGGLMTGNRKAYTFLAESILSFQAPAKTAQMLREAGFSKVDIHPFTLGLSTLIEAQK